jgi:hypothetical protein
VIRFHYHKEPAYLLPGRPRLKGHIECCHVYSTVTDEELALEELLEWAEAHHIPAGWLQKRKGRMPHFDVWGSNLRHCGAGVTMQEFAADERRWRAKEGVVR